MFCYLDMKLLHIALIKIPLLSPLEQNKIPEYHEVAIK
jgi:hypothetical protein